MKLSAGTVVAARFQLVRQLGQGGMGSVWLAQDGTLDTPCAVKFILGEAAESEQMRARFEREAKSAAQLRSPHVVHILDHGISDGTPYIAMEYLEGEDLGQRLARSGQLGAHETVAILSQVAAALVKAQAAGLVHRDLKPANIFLSREEDRDFVRVLDFGVAKSTVIGAGEGNTKTGAMLGTPYYMSPEQARATKAIDYRSDLWALAVIAFRCVTGRLPFVSDSLGDLIIQIVTDPLPVPSEVAPSVPRTFDAWWVRASMRDPALRFQSARELVDALSLALGVAQSGVAGAGSFGPAVPAPPASLSFPVNPWQPSLGVSAEAPVSTGGGGTSVMRSPMGGATPNREAMPSSPEARPGAFGSPGLVASGGTVALSSSAQVGVLTSSVADKPGPRPRGNGLVVALGGGVALLCGAIVAVLVFRSPLPGDSKSGAAPPPVPVSAPSVPPVPPAVTVAPAATQVEPPPPPPVVPATTTIASTEPPASAAPSATSAKPPPGQGTTPVGHPTATAGGHLGGPKKTPKTSPGDQVGF